MIILLSPAKTFNKDIKKGVNYPYFIDKTMALVNQLKKQTQTELKNKLSLSDTLSQNAYFYYQNFNLNHQAAYLYGGQAYKYLKANELEETSLQRLYILSPLYGIINSLDTIALYRLDMKDKILDISLYDYWYQDINDYLNKMNTDLIINLSSMEFSRLLDLKNPKIITIDFAKISNRKLSKPSMLIKKMRGMMANYLLKNKITTKEEIFSITLDGFYYNKEHSSENFLLFTTTI